ncbi:MAG: PilZ domain-containing protein [Terriglobales bacterium]|jgi:PilZ domain-containing protein
MDLRALVVCLDQESANLLMLSLSELGILVEHAPSITQGLELLETHPFNAVVLDYRADQGSEEFLTRLRQSARNRSTLLIAIVDSGFNARPIFGLGANFVLYRPLSSERTRISLRAARGLMRRERRRASRTPVNSKANVAYPGAPELSALLTDLSEGGTSIQTKSRIPSSCKVYFEFALPNQEQMIRLSGEVAWQDASGRTGIRFLDVPQSSRRLMQNWLQQNNAPAPPLGATPQAVNDSAANHSLATPPRTSTEPKLEPKDSSVISNASNRRGEHRFACKLGAEVYRLGSTVPNRCILSDISEGGCYVEMPTPFAGQSGVEILVRTADTKLRISGQAMTIHPGFGMGVRFMFRDSVEREEVLRLLAILAAGPELDEQLR